MAPPSCSLEHSHLRRAPAAHSEYKLRAASMGPSPQLPQNPECDSYIAIMKERELFSRKRVLEAEIILGLCWGRPWVSCDKGPFALMEGAATSFAPASSYICCKSFSSWWTRPRTWGPQPPFTSLPVPRTGTHEGLCFISPEPGQQCQGPGVWPCLSRFGQEDRSQLDSDFLRWSWNLLGEILPHSSCQSLSWLLCGCLRNFFTNCLFSSFLIIFARRNGNLVLLFKQLRCS